MREYAKRKARKLIERRDEGREGKDMKGKSEKRSEGRIWKGGNQRGIKGRSRGLRKRRKVRKVHNI